MKQPAASPQARSMMRPRCTNGADPFGRTRRIGTLEVLKWRSPCYTSATVWEHTKSRRLRLKQLAGLLVALSSRNVSCPLIGRKVGLESEGQTAAGHTEIVSRAIDHVPAEICHDTDMPCEADFESAAELSQ